MTERTAEIDAALARVPRCVWHSGSYPETCWWCNLNRVISPARTAPTTADVQRNLEATRKADQEARDRQHFGRKQ